jgi:hypothetical protein
VNRGYTKRWRKKWDRGYHQDPLLWVMMDYFIDYANYKESTVYCTGVGLIPLKRGEHIYSLRRLSEFMNVDMGQIRRRLKILETIEFLSIRTTNHFSIVSVINYDLYQNKELMFDTPTDTPSDKQTTNQRQTNDKPTALPNKDKKVKKVNNTYACVWPKDFCLTEKMRSYAINKGIVKVDAFFDDFKDWAAAKGATYKDWQAAFRTRIGKAPEYGKQFMGENQSQHDELVEVGNKWLIKNG